MALYSKAEQCKYAYPRTQPVQYGRGALNEIAKADKLKDKQKYRGAQKIYSKYLCAPQQLLQRELDRDQLEQVRDARVSLVECYMELGELTDAHVMAQALDEKYSQLVLGLQYHPKRLQQEEEQLKRITNRPQSWSMRPQVGWYGSEVKPPKKKPKSTWGMATRQP